MFDGSKPRNARLAGPGPGIAGVARPPVERVMAFVAKHSSAVGASGPLLRRRRDSELEPSARAKAVVRGRDRGRVRSRGRSCSLTDGAAGAGPLALSRSAHLNMQSVEGRQ
jgi:hypothetical protein